jgi:hypothetical protein
MSESSFARLWHTKMWLRWLSSLGYAIKGGVYSERFEFNVLLEP